MSEPTAKHIVIDARIRRASTGRPVDRLLEYLQTVDHKSTYTILLEPDDPWKPEHINFVAQPINFPQFSFNPLQQSAYSRYLKKLKPDLVFFTLTAQQPMLYFGTQITFTHDLTMLQYARPGRLPAWLHALRMIGYRQLFRAGNKRASKIIVPSHYIARELAKNYPFTKNKTRVIYEAAEPVASAAPEPLNGVGNSFIFHVGSPFPHKNIDNLVTAFEKLAKKYPQLQLVLAGKKEYYFGQLQKRLDASPVKDRIVVPGFISESQLKWLYQKASAYVLPSLSEGFGLPGLEAMVHGCPLVSSEATCLPEIYGEAAHFFDPHSPDDICQKVADVIDSPMLRRELIEKGYQQVQKYSWRKMAEQILGTFQEVLKSHD